MIVFNQCDDIKIKVKARPLIGFENKTCLLQGISSSSVLQALHDLQSACDFDSGDSGAILDTTYTFGPKLRG